MRITLRSTLTNGMLRGLPKFEDAGGDGFFRDISGLYNFFKVSVEMK